MYTSQAMLSCKAKSSSPQAKSITRALILSPTSTSIHYVVSIILSKGKTHANMQNRNLCICNSCIIQKNSPHFNNEFALRLFDAFFNSFGISNHVSRPPTSFLNLSTTSGTQSSVEGTSHNLNPHLLSAFQTNSKWSHSLSAYVKRSNSSCHSLCTCWNMSQWSAIGLKYVLSSMF